MGLGASYGAAYLGSNDYTFSPRPILALQYGPFFLDPARGLGVEYANDIGFYAGTSIQLDQGRKDEDDLSGMGRIRSSWVLDLAISQALAEWVVVDAGLSFRVAGQEDRGKQYRLGLTFIPYQTDSDVVTFGLTAEMGDKDYNQTYFGVTPEQAARTRFSAFSPSSGVHAQTLQVGWSHVLSKNWSLDAGADVTRLGSKVKNSPIVFDDTNYSISAGISYVF
ncbi:MAG: MipA/OmpV family protein [Lautropia sp.]|nr:MipA/OmpV family protein [Lautropia sp.]